LPFAPRHWQIHYLPLIGTIRKSLIPEIGVPFGEKTELLDGRPGAGAEKRLAAQRIFS
jgi:hypothetical protein